MTASNTSTLAFRLSRADDARAIRRLADLDDAPPLHGQVLLALLDDEPVAAASLSDGRAVANPFLPTADVVALLSLRAGQLRRRRVRRQPWRVPRLRAA